MSYLQSAVDAKLRGLTVRSVLDSLDARARVRTRLSVPWGALSEAEAIPADAWIHWLPSRRTKMKVRNGTMTFESIGAKFSFPAADLPVIEDLMSHRKSPFSELRSRHSQLPVENILLGLISAGLIAVADDSVI
jgi:hypothetical protein